MKKIIIFLLVIAAISSCNPYITKITPVKQLPPITGNEPLIIYDYKQNLPDSSEYIGDIYVSYNPNGGHPSSELLYEKLEKDIKSYGGNAIKIDKSNDLLSGKIYKIKPFENISFNLDSLKLIWKNNRTDNFVGIYEFDLGFIEEKFSKNWVRFACIKRDENYVLIYLNGFEVLNNNRNKLFNINRLWKKGDVYAYLSKTVNKNLFKTTLYSTNKSPFDDALFKFENGNLILFVQNGLDYFRKVFPDSSQVDIIKKTLTGFAINNNRIVTCYHGVSDKNIKIYVKEIKNDSESRHEAVVESSNKINDIAILKLIDSSIVLGENPFFLSNEEKGVADDIFTLGYPLSALMGNEIKLTNGIISSQSGFAGDIAVYQITAPIQPGNSGSPLFDKKGNLIGMINSKLDEAENVGYALKSKILKDFLTKSGYVATFKSQNNSTDKSLAELVKAFQNSIYLIEIIDVSK